MTSSFDQYDCNIMVCTNDGDKTSPGRMFESTVIEPIRPVLTIAKNHVK